MPFLLLLLLPLAPLVKEVVPSIHDGARFHYELSKCDTGYDSSFRYHESEKQFKKNCESKDALISSLKYNDSSYYLGIKNETIFRVNQ